MKIEPQTVRLKNGATIEIRSAVAADAEEIAQHRCITAQETCFLLRYPEECDFDIARWRAALDDRENSKTEFAVTAFSEGKIVGDLEVSVVRNRLKTRHRAHLGVSIQEKFCNCGLGGILLDIALEQAQSHGFEQVELGVFSDNCRAIHLYEKKGFKKYGINPRAFKLKDGTYRDEVIMVRIFSDQS